LRAVATAALFLWMRPSGEMYLNNANRSGTVTNTNEMRFKNI
jgi:hypothetical protein